VTTYEGVHALLKDDKTFVRNPRHVGKPYMGGIQWWMPGIFRVLAQNMLGHDEPDHRRLRKLVDQAFNRQNVENLRSHIGDLCDEFLDQMKGASRADLLEGIARPLPLAVICKLLGLPEEDRPRFRKWVSPLMTIKSLFGLFWAVPALSQLTRYFKHHFAHCRKNPRPGLMTALVQAEQDGDRLSENELLAMAYLLLIAGHETTVHLISGSVLALLENPEQKARLMADWSLTGSAVEELLRFVSPVQMTKPLWVTRDLVFQGQSLGRGETVGALLASANSDPAQFANPEKLDITRSPNHHVAFGMGIHICLGAQLARVEAQVVLQKVFTRFPNLSLAVPASTLKYTGRLGLRALTAMPVRLT
jgi:cytochrome P450